jgi:hypothetical protein
MPGYAFRAGFSNSRMPKSYPQNRQQVPSEPGGTANWT